MEKIPVEDRAKEVKDIKSNINSKALGVRWDVNEDQFYFTTDFMQDKITRRSMLKMIASTFDPLGLISPTLVLAKIAFQDATRLKTPWDEDVPRMVTEKWKAWLRSMNHLETMQFPRCFRPAEFDDAYIELHNFSDASERAYGCCSYIRCINKRGEIHVSLLMSKGKVAPIKSVTIPRLELQAAMLSAKIGTMLQKELDIEIHATYFWVDSEIVLQYIKNEKRRFHTYVGNRVSEIRSLTKPDQWFHVSGKENPADIISRGEIPERLNQNTWIHGPQFLKSFKSDWRMQQPNEHVDLLANDLEVKQDQAFAHLVSQSEIIQTKEMPDNPLD